LTDSETLRWFLGGLSPKDNLVGGTDIGGALAHALDLFDGRTGAHEAIVLLTDGEDLEGRGLEVAREAAERGVHIYVVGMGTQVGGKIPDGERGFVRDESGKEVVSALDGSTLESIAEVSGGAYLPATAAALPLEEIYEKRIALLEGRLLHEGKERIHQDRYQWPLVLALVWAASSFADLLGTGTSAAHTEGPAAGYRLESRRNFTLGLEWVLRDGEEVRGDLVPAADRRMPWDGDPRDRLVVVFVHGLHPMFLDGHWANPVQGNPALPWKAFGAALAARYALGEDLTRRSEFYYWGYRPTRPYPVMARELGAVLQARFPGRRLALVVHSSGALLPRLAHAAGLLPGLELVVGVGAAHGGVQGASFLLARDELEGYFLAHPKRFGPGYPGEGGAPRHPFMDVIRETRAAFLPPGGAAEGEGKIPRAVMASCVWSNEDGAFTPEEREAYGIPAQELPEIRYPRLDHHGEFLPSGPRTALPDLRPLTERTFDLLAAWSPGWARNDSGVVEYPSEVGRSWRYPQGSGFLPLDGTEHKGLLANSELVARVLDQLDELARTGR